MFQNRSIMGRRPRGNSRASPTTPFFRQQAAWESASGHGYFPPGGLDNERRIVDCQLVRGTAGLLKGVRNIIRKIPWRTEMGHKPINLQEKLAKFSDHFSPKIIARMNDYHFKLVKAQGDFIWHSHADTDEVFIVLDGEMVIEFRDGQSHLKAGEMLVVPRGMEHKPFAAKECKVMLVEPAGTINTGDSDGELTADDVWI
jgi:mannose-6-phosphate isomerase-like protein (cupin superfamily)